MNEMTNKIKELRNEIDRIETEIRELERKNSNYYIGVCCEDSDDRYEWDEYYHRLGFISEDKAKVWCEKQCEDDYIINAWYFEVTEEIYKKYGDWKVLDELYEIIDTYKPVIRELDGVVSFKETVSDAIYNVIKEIGLGYSSFKHPADDVVC